MAEDKVIAIIPSSIPWSEIKHKYETGRMNSTEISRQYGVKADTVRKRAQRQQWQTPSGLRDKARELLRKADHIDGQVSDELIEDFKERRNSHRKRMAKIADQYLNDVADGVIDINVSSMNDLKALDDITRRNLGMDIEDEANKQKLVNMSNFESVKPVSPKAEKEGELIELTD